MMDFNKLRKQADQDREAMAVMTPEERNSSENRHETLMLARIRREEPQSQRIEVHDEAVGDEELAQEFSQPPIEPLPLFDYTGGPAGSGKSTVVRERMEQHDGLLLVATTGIAAINVGGTTINSALGFYNTEEMEDMFIKGRLQGKLRRLRTAGVRIIVVDEVSMMDAKQLTYLVRAIDNVNEASEFDGDDTTMMGVHVVGDFCQLPPVKADFAFKSPEWERFANHTTMLTKIHRQNDLDFIEALRACRRGDGQKALEFFRDRMEQRIERDYPGMTIYAKNEEVDRANRLALDDCPGERVTYYAGRWGKEPGEWKQIPDDLHLKEGARVMVLANKKADEEDLQQGSARMRYVNGDPGTLILRDYDPDDRPLDRATYEPPSVWVKLDRGGRTVLVEPVVRQRVIPIETGRVQELIAEGKGSLIKYKKNPETGRMVAKWEIIAEIRYLPLRLAYASTVHKTQGLTLDNVQVSISNPFFANPGSMYVALSRARDPKGLRLVGTPEQFLIRCQADPRVKRYQ